MYTAPFCWGSLALLKVVAASKKGNSACSLPPPLYCHIWHLMGGGRSGYLVLTDTRSNSWVRSRRRSLRISGPSFFPPLPSGTHTGPWRRWNHSESAAEGFTAGFPYLQCRRLNPKLIDKSAQGADIAPWTSKCPYIKSQQLQCFFSRLELRFKIQKTILQYSDCV